MRLNYLTWLKKDLSLDVEEVILPLDVNTLDKLFAHLIERGEPYASVFKKRHVIFAEANGSVINGDFDLSHARELSFFSPIVGG